MRESIIFFSICFLLVFTLSFLSAEEEFGYTSVRNESFGYNFEGDVYDTYFINQTNASEIWITGEGYLDDVSDILGSWINNNFNWINSTGFALLSPWNRSGTNIFQRNLGDSVGIGTTTPDELLDVEGGSIVIDRNKYYMSENNLGTDIALLFIDTNNNTNIGGISTGMNTIFRAGSGEAMRIDEANRVGIGTTSPVAQLHVVNQSDTAEIRVQTNSASKAALVRLINGAQSWFIQTASTENFIIRDATNSLNPFLIEPLTPSNTLYLDSTGKVGINASNPSAPLHIKSNYASYNGISTHLLIQGNNGYPTLTFTSINSPVAAIRTHTGGDNRLGFYTRNSTDYWVERMTINRTSGLVGIGITTPAVKLHIHQSGNATLLRLQDSFATCDHKPEAGEEVVTCISDSKFKTDIVNIDFKTIWNEIKAIPIKQYTYIPDGKIKVGVIAQEIQLTNPDMVHEMTWTAEDLNNPIEKEICWDVLNETTGETAKQCYTETTYPTITQSYLGVEEISSDKIVYLIQEQAKDLCSLGVSRWC